MKASVKMIPARLVRILMARLLCVLFSFVCWSAFGAARTNVVRGADELFWVPTLEQAIEMAQATGRPLFVMGYSLVGNGTTYTKIDSDYCTGVF